MARDGTRRSSHSDQDLGRYLKVAGRWVYLYRAIDQFGQVIDASQFLADGQMMAVYELGGGTFNATVLRKRPEGVEIIGTPEGIERLGGVDFDEAILSYVDYAADGALSDLDMRDPQMGVALARLRQDCMMAKEALSAGTETVVSVFLPDRHVDVRITRADFEDMVRALIESTIGALSRTLQSALAAHGELPP